MTIANCTDTPDTGELRWLPIGDIVPADDNPRQTLTDLDDLAASIAAVGLLTPVVVEDGGDGAYRLVAGARRHAAAMIAGLTELPALVRSFEPLTRKAAMLVENGQRVDLTPLEEGVAYQDLLSLGVEADALAQRVGRPRAEVDGRLAVLALPRSVHKLYADEAITYAEMLLCTQLAEHPEDIDDALTRCTRHGWSVSDAVEHVRADRTRATKAEATRAALTKRKVRVVDEPCYGYGSRETVQRLGTGWGAVHLTVAQHRKERCHAAYIARDGSAVYVCTNSQNHAEDRRSGVQPAPDLKAQRAATRAANKAARQASAARMLAGRQLLTATADSGATLRFILTSVVQSAPWEVAPAAMALLGTDDRPAAPHRARDALITYAATDLDHTLSAALAVHLASAERDASAKHDRGSSGRTVLGYLDLLAGAGYEEQAGDAAVRERYQHLAADAAEDTTNADDDQEEDAER